MAESKDQSKKDLLLLFVGGSWEYAMGLISNRYAAQIPMLYFSILLALPLLFTLAWIIKMERQDGRVRALLAKHRISTIVLALLLLFVGWNTFTIYRSKLQVDLAAHAGKAPPSQAPIAPAQQQNNNSPTLAQDDPKVVPPKVHPSKKKSVPPPIPVHIEPTTQQPPQQQGQQPTYAIGQCVGSACAQGPGAQATYNQFGETPRRITEEQKVALEACLSKNPGTASVIAIVNSPEATDLGADWLEIFHKAKWKVDPDMVGSFLIGGGVWSGTHIDVRGTYDEQTKTGNFDHSSPEGGFIDCAMGKTIGKASDGGGASIILRPDLPANLVRVSVGPHP